MTFIHDAAEFFWQKLKEAQDANQVCVISMKNGREYRCRVTEIYRGCAVVGLYLNADRTAYINIEEIAVIECQAKQEA